MIKGKNKDVPSDSSSISVNQSLGSQFENFQKRYDAITTEPIQAGPLTERAKYANLKDVPFHSKEFVANQITNNNERWIYTIPLTEDDVKAAEEKIKLSEQLKFDRWIGQSYQPDNNPAYREWLQQVYPQYFEARQKQIEEEERLRSKIRSIDLHGPKDLEDLWIQWRCANNNLRGQLGIAQQNAMDPHARDAQFQRGILNAFKTNRYNVALRREHDLDHYNLHR